MPRFYQQLTYPQRCQIAILKERGDSPAKIAKLLGRSKSTITRELQRNTEKNHYHMQQADTKAKQRRCRTPTKMTPILVKMIEAKLALQWSPEQISGRLKLEGINISHTTIYKHIWQDKKNGGFLYKQLRHRGKKYNKKGKNTAGRGCIPNRKDIDLRPSIVNEKSRVGDWELDTIIGSNHNGVIVSMVDRYSKLTKLIKVADKTAEAVSAGLIEKLGVISNFVLTLTADNGKEFAQHVNVANTLGAEFFFAKPYHSWERGLNEHTNGLVRQYLPKGTEFSDVSQEEIETIEMLLNERPRKVLKFQTPQESFDQWIKSSIGAI